MNEALKGGVKVLALAAAVGLLAGCGNERRGGAEDFETPGPAEESPPSLQPGEVYDRGGAPTEPGMYTNSGPNSNRH